MMASSADQWLWMEGTVQHGPATDLALISVFQRQISLRDQLATISVWHAGMDKWVKAVDTPPFRDHIIALLSAWYIADPAAAGGRLGPFTTQELSVKFSEGDVDGLTMLFGQSEHADGGSSSGGGWAALAELSSLKAAITALSSEEEEGEEEGEGGEGAVVAGSQGGVKESDMVFVFGGGTEEQPALPEEWLKKDDGEEEEMDGDGGNVKKQQHQQATQRYTADDGTRLVWQESVNGGGGGGDWVEYTGLDEDWDEDDREDEQQQQQGDGKKGGKDGKGGNRGVRGAGAGAAGGGRGNGDGGDKGDDDAEAAATKKRGAADDDSETTNNNDNKPKQKKKKKTKKKAGWSDKTNHNWVYVENLPTNTLLEAEEIVAHFSKCGVLALEPATQKPWVKVYLDRATGLPKGDASVCYAMADSVALAIQVLDGGRLRANSEPITVKKAEFNLKGAAYDPSLRGRVSGAAKKVAKAAAAQALTWADDDEDGGQSGGGKGNPASLLKIVVLIGMFTLADIEEHQQQQQQQRDNNGSAATQGEGGSEGESGSGPSSSSSSSFEEELTGELASELEAKCGEPDKITVFSKNPKGVVVVKFKSAFSAGECVKLMHGRFFAGQQLSCTYWDGVTDYTVEEAEEQAEKRVEQFGDWIDEQELPPELQLQVEE